MCTAQFDNTNFAYCPSQCICIFRLILTINGHEFHIQHSVILFCYFHDYTVCSLWGTNWILIHNWESLWFSLAMPWGRCWVYRLSVKNDSVQSQANPCGICGGRSGIGTGFPPNTSVCLSVFSSPCSMLACIYVTLPRGQISEAWETSKSSGLP